MKKGATKENQNAQCGTRRAHFEQEQTEETEISCGKFVFSVTSCSILAGF